MVYKDCNIGSAKPDEKTLKKYPHHLISLKSLDNIFTVSDFCECANKLIIEAHKNGKLPVLVGGSMMYFKSLFDGIHDLPDRDEEYREELKKLKNNNPDGYLFKILKGTDPVYANFINKNDDMRIIRALEIYKNSNKKMSDILNQAVAALTEKLNGQDFDGIAKFSITDEGSVVIDSDGARVSDDEADVTLSASAEVFEAILEGEQNSTAAFMTGKLSVDGDMGMAMKLAGILG